MQHTHERDSNWYWSQRGNTMGPIDFTELRRLAAAGSVAPTTWVHHPSSVSWVQASTIAGLFEPNAGVASAPPDAPPQGEFCRCCGAHNLVGFTQCAACGHQSSVRPLGGLDPKLAAIICRASILATLVAPILSIGAPIAVWAAAGGNPALLREAKAALNCHITILIVGFAAVAIAVVGLLIVIGPIIGAILAIALVVYTVAVGIMGLIAAGNDQPFEYPLTIKLIK